MSRAIRNLSHIDLTDRIRGLSSYITRIAPKSNEPSIWSHREQLRSTIGSPRAGNVEAHQRGRTQNQIVNKDILRTVRIARCKVRRPALKRHVTAASRDDRIA